MLIRIRPDGVSLADERDHVDTVTLLLPAQFTGDDLHATREDARILIDMLATGLELAVVDPNQPRECRNCGQRIVIDGATWMTPGGDDHCPNDIDGEHAPRDLEV